MSRLKSVSYREFIRRIRVLGFEGPQPGAKQPIFVRKRRAYHVPNPHRGVISVDLLARVLKQLETTRREWESTA